MLRELTILTLALRDPQSTSLFIFSTRSIDKVKRKVFHPFEGGDPGSKGTK